MRWRKSAGIKKSPQRRKAKPGFHRKGRNGRKGKAKKQDLLEDVRNFPVVFLLRPLRPLRWMPVLFFQKTTATDYSVAVVSDG